MGWQPQYREQGEAIGRYADYNALHAHDQMPHPESNEPGNEVFTEGGWVNEDEVGE